MPKTFGSSCEPREESPREKRRRERRAEREQAALQVDPFERIVTLCSVRDRSSRELRERLLAEGHESSKAEAALQRALDCGLVDDFRFADGFIRGRVSSGKGLQGVLKDLEKHGIDPEQLEGWPESYALDDECQIERAIELLDAHPPKAKDLWGAAYRKLISRGYGPSIASRATRIWAEGRQGV